MSKIYIVTSGDYSDYSIDGVFDSKERAQAFAAPFSDREIEEHELNPPLPTYIKPGQKFYDVTMFSDGELPISNVPMPYNWYAREITDSFLYNKNPFAMRFACFVYPHFNNQTQEATGKHRMGEFTLEGVIRANDSAHAIKIMNERRTQLVANNDWPEKIIEWCNEPENGHQILGFEGKWPEDFVSHDGWPHIHDRDRSSPKVPEYMQWVADYEHQPEDRIGGGG